MTSPGSASPRTTRGFDLLAPFYDTLSGIAFAGRIHASQTVLLPRLPQVDRALVIGGGAGRFLEALLSREGRTRVVSIDASRAMNRLTAARLARSGALDRAELRTGGLESLGAEEQFDLVVTHCFLDLFEEPELSAVVSALSAALTPGGHWLISDFEVSGPGLTGGLKRSIVALLYAFFKATCDIRARRLADFAGAFQRAGLFTVDSRRFLGGLLRAELFLKAAPAGR